MTATTTATKTRRARRVLALVLAVGSLALPASAGAAVVGYSSPNAIEHGVEQTSPPVDESSYSSINAIEGNSSTEPTIVTGSSEDGFDWLSAAVGAGAVMALVALGGAGFLTFGRRGAPSTSTS